jgi:predicted acylesterase/phospholipase RssA
VQFVGLVFACAAPLASVCPASAQQALVLSGGAARGLAHVGVLLELNDHGYEPDIVVGNSMGAVIGALFAAGYGPDDIRERTLAVEWGELFDPTPVLLGPAPMARLPMLSLSLDLQHRRVSRGLFGEWRINRALVRLLFDANARARGDFDRLARRYRAVAADLETGERVVLGSGDLARAARASMAYPGFFAPVHWGEQILVDGGIVDNLPTTVARDLGATSIIAVDVSRSPQEITSLQPLSVAQRALNLMQQNLQPDPLPPDILVLPVIDAGSVGPGFPDDPVPVIEVGTEAARRDLPSVRTIENGRERPLPPAPERFSALRIEAPDSALAALGRQVFGSLAPGPYDASAVLVAIDRLYSTGLLTGVWPHVVEAETPGGDPLLVVRLDAAAGPSLSVGAGYENDRGGRAWLALERYSPIGRRPAVLTAAASTDGLERWAALSVRFALARPSLAWSLGGHMQENSVRTFGDDTRTTVEVLRAGGWLGVEFPHLLRERVITLTGRAEWLEPEDAAGGASLGPLLRLTSLPSQAAVVGVPLLLEAESRWGDHRYWRAAFSGSRVLEWRALQAAALIDLRAVSDEAPSDVRPALGDQHAVPGLRWGEVRGRARAVVGIDVALPTPLGGLARLRLRGGAVADEPEDWQDARWIGGLQIGGVWRIPLGVLEAGYGHATIGDGRFDVSIGRTF